MRLIQTFVASNKLACKWLRHKFPRVFQGAPAYPELSRRIEADRITLQAKRILECGGVDRPFLAKNRGFEYIGLDIEEKPDCHLLYDRFLVQSVEHPIPVKVDIVISTTLMEHVCDTDAAFSAIYNCLQNGGATHHYVPCKWHPYSMATRLVGWGLQKALINLLRPEASARTGYKTFYDNCTPHKAEALLKSVGFKEIDILPFYRATEYFDFFVPAYVVVGLGEYICEKLSLRVFAAGMIVSAKK